MSVIVSNKALISVIDTDVECPICTCKLDVSNKIDKAKYPIFKIKCPGCKSAIGISIPIFGGNTKCFEWNPPKTKEDNQLRTETPFTVNGIVPVKKVIMDNDEDQEIFV
jgi:hypothetical protein